MKIILIIYIFALFILFTPNMVFKFPIKNKLLHPCIHALLFSIVFYFSYNFLGNIVEGMEQPNDLERILIKLIERFYYYKRNPIENEKLVIVNTVEDGEPDRYPNSGTIVYN